MTCQSYRDLMMGYLDDELTEEERKRFENHLATCSACAQEFRSFGQLKEMTDGLALAEPEDRIWENYWGQVYNRVERGMGWILLSVAGICLADAYFLLLMDAPRWALACVVLFALTRLGQKFVPGS